MPPYQAVNKHDTPSGAIANSNVNRGRTFPAVPVLQQQSQGENETLDQERDVDGLLSTFTGQAAPPPCETAQLKSFQLPQGQVAAPLLKTDVTPFKLSQPVPIQRKAEGVVQLTSAFSAWFISEILIGILEDVANHDKKAPPELGDIIGAIKGFLTVDDDEAPEWETAVIALRSLFEQLGDETHHLVLGHIIAGLVIEKLESEESSANILKLISYLSAVQRHLISSLPDEENDYGNSDYSSDDEDAIPEDLTNVFSSYSKITDPLRRPGHLNPYRHGIGHSDTIAILIRDRLNLVSRNKGIDPAYIEELEAEFKRIDAEIKRINDTEEKPALIKKYGLQRQIDEILDRDPDADVTAIEKQIERLDVLLQQIREGRRSELRVELRKLYEAIFWISKNDRDDRNKAARKRQEKEFFNLSREKGFENSFRRAEQGEDEFDEKEGSAPDLTSHHSEQRILVSEQWLIIRQEILDEIRDILTEGADIEEIAQLLTPIVVTMSINRSSCYVCNAFLVADLISLWKEIAGLIGKVTWQQIRDKLKDIINFEVTYSVPYSKVKDVEEMNQQLRLAGWTVYGHELTEKSDDEGEHEKLVSGGTISSEVKKQSSKKKSKAKKHDSDSDDYSEEEAESQLQVMSAQTRSLQRLIGTLTKYFKRMVKRSSGSNDPISILTELGFEHHPMPGAGLNCALYSIRHQLAQQGIAIPNFDEFSTSVRQIADLEMNTMIDVLNNGRAVLNAVVTYLLSKHIITESIALSLKIWSAVNGGGVIEYNQVASSTTDGGPLQLVLYFNGVNHFDSLTGGAEMD